MSFNSRDKFLYGSDTIEYIAQNDIYNDLQSLECNNYCDGNCCYCMAECKYKEY